MIGERKEKVFFTLTGDFLGNFNFTRTTYINQKMAGAKFTYIKYCRRYDEI